MGTAMASCASEEKMYTPHLAAVELRLTLSDSPALLVQRAQREG